MECTCTSLCTSKMDIFASLDCEEQRMLVNKASHLECKKGEFIFRESEPADKIIVIRYGKIKLNRYSSEGKEYVIDILAHNDFYGEQNVFGGSLFDVNAIALERTAICSISYEAIYDLVLEHPEIGMKLLTAVGEKLSAATEMLEILSTNDAKAKLAGFLLFRSKRLKRNTLELTREDISAHINLRRETISRKLSEFEAEGLVSLSGHKTIKLIDKHSLSIIYNSGKK